MNEAETRAAVQALRPVVGKAHRYLRVATILLSVAMILAATIVIYLDYQTALRRKNFDTNTNLHVVTVSHSLSSGSITPLSLSDVSTLQSSAVAQLPGVTVAPSLTLGVGMTLGGEPVHVIGFDPQAGPLIGVKSMRDGIGYSVPGKSGPQDLTIPVITSSTDSGMSSNRLEKFRLTDVSASAEPQKVTYLVGGQPGRRIFVTTATFWKIAQIMLDMPRSQIEAAAAAGSLGLIPLVDAVYVNVSDLTQVRPVAQRIREEGFALSYALEAFDEIENSLARERAIGYLLGALLIVALGGYFLTAWQSYLRLSRRDIGILKHWRVPRAVIITVYARQLWRSVLVALASSLTVLLIGDLAVDAQEPVLLLAKAAALALALLLVAALARFVILPRWLRRDVLTLLRLEREFQ